MTFAPIRDFIPISLEAFAKSESPIETKMLHGFSRCKKYTFINHGDKPEGEGLFILPQVQIGPYRADFLIKAVGYKSGHRQWPPNKSVYVCVECDGAEFHTSPEQRAHDKKRDDYFMSRGIKTFRYSGSLIHKNAELIATDLAAHLAGEVFKP